MIIIKCVLLSLLITSLIYHMMTYKEPVTLECCGGVLRGVHYSETDRKPPRIIRRCFNSDSDWESMPCTGTGGNCCKAPDGKSLGTCVPTTKGGYCGDRSNAKDARTNRTISRDSEKGGEIDVNDERSVQLDDIRETDPSVILAPENLQERDLIDRRKRLNEYRYSGSDISNITYSIEEYNRYTAILWLYILHIFFILVLLFLLRDNIDKSISQYVGLFKEKKMEFST